MDVQDRNLRKSSAEVYYKAVRRFMLWCRDNKRTVSTKTIEDYVNYLKTGSKKLRPRTIRIYFVALQRFATMCNIPMPKMRLPAVSKRNMKYLSKEDYVKLHNSCENALQRALLSVTYAAALRIGETLSRRVCHLINFDVPGEEALFVGNDDYFLTKTSVDATLPLTPSAVTDLKEYLAEREEVKKDDYIFMYNGKPLQERQANRIWHRMLELAQIPRKDRCEFGWHVIRHTRATHLRMDGVPIDVIKDMLRHTSLATTMIYAEIDTASIRRVTAGKDPLEKMYVRNVQNA